MSDVAYPTNRAGTRLRPVNPGARRPTGGSSCCKKGTTSGIREARAGNRTSKPPRPTAVTGGPRYPPAYPVEGGNPRPGPGALDRERATGPGEVVLPPHETIPSAGPGADQLRPKVARSWTGSWVPSRQGIEWRGTLMVWLFLQFRHGGPGASGSNHRRGSQAVESANGSTVSEDHKRGCMKMFLVAVRRTHPSRTARRVASLRPPANPRRVPYREDPKSTHKSLG